MFCVCVAVCVCVCDADGWVWIWIWIVMASRFPCDSTAIAANLNKTSWITYDSTMFVDSCTLYIFLIRRTCCPLALKFVLAFCLFFGGKKWFCKYASEVRQNNLNFYFVHSEYFPLIATYALQCETDFRESSFHILCHVFEYDNQTLFVCLSWKRKNIPIRRETLLIIIKTCSVDALVDMNKTSLCLRRICAS